MVTNARHTFFKLSIEAWASRRTVKGVHLLKQMKVRAYIFIMSERSFDADDPVVIFLAISATKST
jgi:hypothetical protein